MGNITFCGRGQVKTFVLDGFSTTILSSFSTNFGTGLSWTLAGDLWLASRDNRKLYAHDGATSTIIDSVSTTPISAFSNPEGISVGIDESEVNYAERSTVNKIYKLDGFTTVILDSITTPNTGTTPFGLTDDGVDIHWTNTDLAKIFKGTGFTTTIKDSYISPIVFPHGSGWDGTDSYLNGLMDLYHHSGFTSTILDSIDTLTVFGLSGVEGIEWDDTAARLGVAPPDITLGLHRVVHPPENPRLFSTGSITRRFIRRTQVGALQSPAFVLAQLLIERSLTDAHDAPCATFPTFVSWMPDTGSIPDNVVVLYDAGGVDDGRLMDGTNIDHFGVQVAIRAKEFQVGWVKIREIALALEKVKRVTITIGDFQYLIHNVSQQAAPIHAGLELGTKRRHLITLNLLLTLEEM